MHTHAHAHEEAASMCAHERAAKKKGRDGEGTEGGANGKKQSLKGGGPGGPGYAREREKETERGRRTVARKSSREEEGDARGTDGDDRRAREGSGGARRKAEKGGSRILTERWGMSRRVVCSHGSSLGTAVQYAGQGKVTLLCVRARAGSRFPTLSRVSACTHVHYTQSLSRCDSIVVGERQ